MMSLAALMSAWPGGRMAASTRAAWLKEAAAAGNAFHWRTRAPWRHNLINLGSLLLVVLGFVATGALAGALPWWAGIPLGAILFGPLLFSLFILVIHECSHAMFLLARDAERVRALNHLLGDLAAALVFTNYRLHWEKGHTAHHLHPTEPEIDPQNPDPLDGPRLERKLAFLAVVPGYAFMANPSGKYAFAPLRFFAALGFWALVALALGAAFGWPAAVALLLGWNVVAALNLLKIAQEHGSALRHEPDPWLRSRTYFYPLWPVFSPFNINYHFEHHLNFSVPWYLLPAYHRKIMGLVPEEIRPYLLTRGAAEYVEQAAGRRPNIPEGLRGLVEVARGV